MRKILYPWSKYARRNAGTLRGRIAQRCLGGAWKVCGRYFGPDRLDAMYSTYQFFDPQG
jgi:hypothetical protein